MRRLENVVSVKFTAEEESSQLLAKSKQKLSITHGLLRTMRSWTRVLSCKHFQERGRSSILHPRAKEGFVWTRLIFASHGHDHEVQIIVALGGPKFCCNPFYVIIVWFFSSGYLSKHD